MLSRVLPLPRCAALITMVSTLKNVPPIMIRKYSTAASWVSALLPASCIICGVKTTNSTVTTTHSAKVSARAVRVISFASRWLRSPLRRATSADRAMLIAKNTVRPMNLGWPVRPTAATA